MLAPAVEDRIEAPDPVFQAADQHRAALVEAGREAFAA